MFVTGTLETEVNKGEKSHPISTTQRHTPIVEIFMQNDLSRLNAFMEKFSLKKKMRSYYTVQLTAFLTQLYIANIYSHTHTHTLT